MGLSYAIDVGANRVNVIVSGRTTYEEWEASLRTIFHDPDYRPGFDFLSDRREANPPPTIDAIRRGVAFFELHRTEFGNCRWAVVVSELASYGMGRMAEMLSAETGVRLRVFHTMDDAGEWLAATRAGAE